MINLSDKAGFNLTQRHRAETRFRWTGRMAIFVSLSFLVLMIGSILIDGLGASKLVQVAVPINLTDENVDPNDIADTSFGSLLKRSLRDQFPAVEDRKDKKKLYNLLSPLASLELESVVTKDASLLGEVQLIWLTASDDLSLLTRGYIDTNVPEDHRRVSDQEIEWVNTLQDNGMIRTVANWGFLKNGDSREPEIAGILSALVGSAMSLAVCLAISFPFGIAAAIYLEEFAAKNWISDVIEVNINNLAAVPSIVFGLLGLSILLGYFGMPRSSPLVGGIVLALMTLPTIIIASRASLQSVPPSIKEAALAIGASPVQAVFHHVFPVALPGMLTGAIVGMARALGDTAPLLMIGMVAFIVDVPKSILEPATALPVQIFLWADSPERAFSEKTAAAIIVLLFFLILMNLVAILLRRKFEQRF